MQVPRKLETKKSCLRLVDRNIEEDGKNGARSNEKANSIKPSSHSKRKKKEGIKDLLKDSYMFVRQQNQHLSAKLRKKSRRIEELKDTIRDYENKLREYENIVDQEKQLMKNKNNLVIHTKQSEDVSSSRKNYQFIRQSQDLAMKTLQKYKKIEKQMEIQRQQYQQRIQVLNSMIGQLKQQNGKLSLKIQEIQRNKGKGSRKNSALKRQSESELMVQIRELRQKQVTWLRKQIELKKMLSEITIKINAYEANYRASEGEALTYKNKYQQLNKKYKRKILKHKQLNEKWGNIFTDFMKQTQSLDKEIQTLKNLLYIILKKQTGKNQ